MVSLFICILSFQYSHNVLFSQSVSTVLSFMLSFFFSAINLKYLGEFMKISNILNSAKYVKI